MLLRRLLIPVFATAISFPALAQDCDRSCLAGFLDSYLNAIVANDASQAPLSYGFRQTETQSSNPMMKVSGPQ